MLCDVGRKDKTKATRMNEAKGYEGSIGASTAIIEAAQNDFKINEAFVLDNMQIDSMIQEGATKREIRAFAENSITNFLSRIKDMLLKLWEKIKAIYKGFEAKFMATVGMEGKKFVDRYKKIVRSKDLSKFEIDTYDFNKMKEEVTVDNLDELSSNIKSKFDTTFTKGDTEKVLEDWDTEEETEKMWSITAGNDTNVTSVKDYIEKMEETNLGEKTERPIGPQLSSIEDILVNNSKTIKNLTKNRDNVDKEIKRMIEVIKKAETSLSKVAVDYSNNTKGEVSSSDSSYLKGLSKNRTDPGYTTAKGSSGTDFKSAQNAVSILSKYINIYQSVMLKSNDVVINIFKKRAAAARAAYAACVGQKSGTGVAESFFMEAAEYDVYSV